jgi:RNA polymerase sigma-70 factor (sigma-E family)
VSRSRESFTAYAECSWARLFRTAYAITGSVSDADDLLQARLVNAYTHWGRVSKARTQDAYVRKMMVNLAISRRRSPSARREHPVADILDDRATDAAFDDAIAGTDEIWQAVQELPARQRAVLVLRYYEDLSERVIATVLDVAPGTVKSLANAAIRHLRTAMTDQVRYPEGRSS